MRHLAVISMILLVGSATGRADILQPTATLPPPNGAYGLPVVCITPVCLVNANVSAFQIVSDVLSGGDELVSTTALFSALIFANNGGVRGAALGSVSIAGTVDFVYFDRSLSTPLGSFDAEITAFSFMGTFNAHPFAIRNNPLMATTGVTTINQVSPGGLYTVSSYFDIFAELSIDNSPFVPGPKRTATLSEIPEPATAGLALLGLAGILAGRRNHDRMT